jgi:hypothetical protein
MSTVQYPLAVDHWRETDIICIRSQIGTTIASFPLEFVRRGGDDTWQYVLCVVGQLVDHPPEQLGVIKSEDGTPVNLAEAPCVGSFR